MLEIVQEMLVSAFGQNSWLAVVMVSLMPMLELHTAIPFGMSTEFWGSNALGVFPSFFWGFLGSCILVPIVLLIVMPVLKWLKRTKLLKRISESLEARLNRNKAQMEVKMQKRTSGKSSGMQEFYKITGIALLVALPIPFSGVYTGCLLALVMGLGFWKSLIALYAGNLIGGLLMVAVCTVFKDSATVIAGAFFVLMLVTLVFGIIKLLVKPKEMDKGSDNESPKEVVLEEVKKLKEGVWGK